MAFFSSAVSTLSTLVTAIGAGLGVWGVVNLLEGYGNDNPGAKSQGIKQLMAGAGIMALGTTLIPQLSSLFRWKVTEIEYHCRTYYGSHQRYTDQLYPVRDGRYVRRSQQQSWHNRSTGRTDTEGMERECL